MLKSDIIHNMSKKGNPEGLRTWIEIDRAALKHNVGIFRSLIKKETKLCAVLKSNAYGHSLIDFAKEVEKIGVDMIAVDSITEALALRRDGIKVSIFVLGFTLPEMLSAAIENDIAVTVSHIDHFNRISELVRDKALSVHVKVDTGMHRQGFLLDEIDTVIELLKKNKEKINVSGLFTHFASAKNPAFPEYTKKQIAEFEIWKKAFFDAGFSPVAHASATAGTLLFTEAHYDMVRIGIGLYGLWPSSETKSAMESKCGLKPVLSWKTIVSEVKKLKTGDKVGYDCTEVLWRDSVVGVLPIGYWHGYPRALSSIGHVLVKGVKARVLGRVSMDMITVDLTDVPDVSIGEVVTLIGKDNEGEITAPWLSGLIDASHYELITRINPLIKRLYL